MSGLASGNDCASHQLDLPRELDMRAAAPLKSALAKTLEGGGAVVIEAASVERMSTACVQIMLAYVTTARKLGRPIVIRRPSATFVDAFTVLGLARVVNDWNIEA
jgi:chemotaxis protein CheX